MDDLRRVAVGSTNPVKVEAARVAFDRIWPESDWISIGTDVNSSVSDQPMDDQECITGAMTRAYRSLQRSNADFGVGLEGGIHKVISGQDVLHVLSQLDQTWFDQGLPDELDDFHFDCGWAVVIDRQGMIGMGSTIRMHVPPAMMDQVFQGLELGLVDDHFFGQENSKQKAGHFGLMTNGHITRLDAYTHGVISALTHWLHPHLFDRIEKK